MAIDYADDDFIFDTQWLAMKRAINGDGILSGMAITPNGTQPPLEVDIASGVFYANQTKVTYGGGSQALTAAHATFDRWDLLSGNPGGTVDYTAGTATAAPKPPDLPANHIIIAMIYVPATVTSILASYIRNFGFFSQLLEHGSRHLPDNGDGLTVGAPSDIGVANAAGSANAFVRQDHVHKHPSGLGTDLHHLKQHALGAAADHTSATIAQLNALISDATLDDAADTRTPTSHDHTKHTDRTRKISFDIWNGTVWPTDPSYDPLRVQAVLDLKTYWGRELLPSALSADIRCNHDVPIGYVSNGAMKIIYVADNSGAGNASIQTTVYYFKDGALSISQQLSSVFSVTQHSGNGAKVATIGTLSVNLASYDFIHVGIQRNGAAGSDTFTGNIYLLGAWLEYTADQ